LAFGPSHIAQGSIGQRKQWFDVRPGPSHRRYGQQGDQQIFQIQIQAEKRPEDGVQTQEEAPRARISANEAGSAESNDLFTSFFDAAIPPAITCLVIALMLETYHFTNGFGLLPDPIVPVLGGVPLTEALILLTGPGFLLTTALGVMKGNH